MTIDKFVDAERKLSPLHSPPPLSPSPCEPEGVQAEMDQVLGPGRPPSLSDRGRLPYTEATIMEVQRMTVVVPLAIPHMASHTTGEEAGPRPPSWEGVMVHCLYFLPYIYIYIIFS